MNVPLICDYGSGFSKVGFAGTEAPLAVFPTTLGKLRHEVSARRPPCGPQPTTAPHPQLRFKGP